MTLLEQALRAAQSAGPSDVIEDRLTDSDALETAAQDIQGMLVQVLDALPQGAVDALRGEWLGHPVHPILVHLPLGGWMIAAALDHWPAADGEERERREAAADQVLLAGTVGGAAALAAGWAEWAELRGQPRRTGLLHGALSEGAWLLNVGSLVARRRGHRGLGKALSGAGLGLAVAGGLLGGQLVYRHHVG